MRKYILISLCSLGLLFTGCDNEITSSLDGSVDERVDAVLQEYIKELSGAQHGWLLRTHTNQGIFTFWVDFGEDNRVTMSTDNLMYDPVYRGTFKESSYRITHLQRPTISFDTYNYIHLLNDPNNAISGGSGNLGLVTDFEFEINDYTDGIFTLQGRLNKVRAFMRKATAEEKEAVAAGEMMTAIEIAADYSGSDHLRVVVEDYEVALTMGTRNAMVNFVEKDGVTITSIACRPYYELDYDIGFDAEVKVGNTVLTGLKYNSSAGTYTVLTQSGNELEIHRQSVPVLGLHLMYGPNKSYTYMASIISFYQDLATNALGQALNEVYSNPLQGHRWAQGNMFLERTETGVDNLRWFCTIGTAPFYATWTYYITFNEDRTVFKVDRVTTDGDAVGNATAFNGMMSPFHNYLVGKSFRIEWSTIPYGNYTMGSFVNVDDPNAKFYGALF